MAYSPLVQLENKGDPYPLSPRFIVDGMLGSLARKLRILGYDTVFDKISDDDKLLSLAQESGRTLITADIGLFLIANKKRVSTIFVRGRNDSEKLFQVLSGIGCKKIDLELTSRCSMCNGVLKNSGEFTEKGVKTYECTVCSKRYWRGAHWKKLESLFRDVDQKLRSDNGKI